MPSGFINPVATASLVSSQQIVTAKLRQRRRIIFWLVMALLLGGLTVAGYLWIIEPKVALAGYLQRLTTARTFTFATAATVDSQAESVRVKVTTDGQADVRDQSNPKLDIKIKAEVGLAGGVVLPAAGISSGTVAAHLKLTNDTLYMQLSQMTLLSELFPIKISDSWYSYKLASSESVKRCTSSGKVSGNILGISLITKVPITHDSFRGYDSINGSPRLHYVGTLDNAKLAATIDEANKNLSADCKIDITAEDYQDVSVTYELWRGWSADRIKIAVTDSGSKTTASLTIDSAGYGKAVTIEPPADAKNITTIIQDMITLGTPEEIDVSSRLGPLGAEGTADQKARDTQRKSDIQIISTALEVYFADNNHYPATLKPLIVKTEGRIPYLRSIPVDPVNKAPYSYSYQTQPAPPAAALPSTYTLSACLENAADTGADVIDPVAPCTAATYQLKSEK